MRDAIVAGPAKVAFMRLIGVACLIFAACVSPRLLPPGRECVTTCGAELHAGSDDCEAFKAAEPVVLEVMARHTGWPREGLCKSLNGFAVGVYNTPNGQWFSREHGTFVSGMTDCHVKFITLGDADWQHNAYIHEIAHVYECSKGLWNDSVEHKNWDAMGITAAIEEHRNK